MIHAAVSRLRCERGQTSAEYIGLILVVVAIIGAIAFSGVGATITQRIQDAICQIGGGSCDDEQRAADEPCVTSTSSREANLNVQIVAVDIEQGGSYLREDRWDGSQRTTVFTISDSASLAGALRAGVKGKVGNVGFDATAEAAAGGRLTGAVQYTVPTGAADEIEQALRRQGGIGQLLRDGAESGLAGPLIDAALDKILGEDEPDLPATSAQFVAVEAIGEIGGEIGAEAGPLGGADLQAVIEAAGGARRITSGPDEGDLEIYIQLDGSAAGSLSLATLGPAVSGDTSAVAVLTLREGRTPTRLQVTASAGYEGSISLAERLDGADLDQVAAVLERAAVAGSSGGGRSLEFGASLDLADAESLAAARALLIQGAAGVPRVVALFDEHGTLTLQAAETSGSEFEAELNVGLGLNLGAGGEESSSDSETTSALIRRPGSPGFAIRDCG